jgi:hypothetical protein
MNVNAVNLYDMPHEVILIVEHSSVTWPNSD